MIIGICGPLTDKASQLLSKYERFQIVGLQDPAKRFCDTMFDFKNIWSEEKMKTEDNRYLIHKSEYVGGRRAVTPNVYLTPERAVGSLKQWGDNCFKSIWADYAANVAKTLVEETEFDDAAFYSKREGLKFGQLGPCEKTEHVCITEISSIDEIETLKRHGIKVIYIKSMDDKAPGDESGVYPLIAMCDHVVEDGGKQNTLIEILKLPIFSELERV